MSIREAVTRTIRSERVAATSGAPRANDPRAISLRFSISRSLWRAIATSSERPRDEAQESRRSQRMTSTTV